MISELSLLMCLFYHLVAMLHQVEFLIEGNLLPITMGELRVSENLLIEKAWQKGSESFPSYEQKTYCLAYVAVDAPKEAHYFFIARDYLDFFLLIYSLVSGQPVTTRVGVGIPLDDLSSLGAGKVSFSNFEKIHFEGQLKDDFLSRPIFEAKKLFLLLLPDRQRIMESSLGLALIYYYLAVLASRRRLEEAVIHLMIAGEALLCTETIGAGRNLSRRLSILVAEDEAERAEISKKMQELYSLRSGIVHGGGKKPSFSDVKNLFDYVKRAVERGLSLRNLSKKALVAKLDKNI